MTRSAPPAEIFCKNCGTAFALTELSGQHKQLIDSLAAKGASLAMVDCPRCQRSVPVELREEAKGEQWKCPMSHCDGWVNEISIDADHFWGCGECGCCWKKQENLIRDITASIKKFPYRAVFYQQANGTLRPSAVTAFPGDSAKFAGEPQDNYSRYQRD